MTAAVALLAIAVLVVVVLVVAFAMLSTQRARSAPWALREQSDGEALTVLAVKPGQKPLVVGRIPFGAADFDSQLYEARAEGRDKVQALNQKS